MTARPSNPDDLPPPQDVIEHCLASVGGGEEAVVIVEESSAAEVRFANNTTTTNGVRRDRRVTVITFREVGSGRAMTSGTASRTGDIDVPALMADSIADARSSPPADDASDLVKGVASPTSFDLAPADTDLSTLAGVLGELGAAFARAEASGTVLAGFAEHSMDTVYLGSSTGLRLRHVQPSGAFHLAGRSGDGTNTAWVGRGTADFEDVAVGEIEHEVHRRLAWGERRLTLPAGRYPVVLPPSAVADLMIALTGAVGGKDAEDGLTVFSGPGWTTRVGETLSALPFCLYGNSREAGLECLPFVTAAGSGPDVSVFDNGLPIGRTTWLDGGRLAALGYHRAGAATSGVQPAPPVGNLVLQLDGATGTVDDLVAGTERGLLLTCLWYIRELDAPTLLVTGLTRDGVYLIEDGVVVGAVNNFRFNESPVDLLARATAAGATERALGREFGEWVNRTAMPPLTVPDFNMSSTSAAS